MYEKKTGTPNFQNFRPFFFSIFNQAAICCDPWFIPKDLWLSNGYPEADGSDGRILKAARTNLDRGMLSMLGKRNTPQRLSMAVYYLVWVFYLFILSIKIYKSCLGVVPSTCSTWSRSIRWIQIPSHWGGADWIQPAAVKHQVCRLWDDHPWKVR